MSFYKQKNMGEFNDILKRNVNSHGLLGIKICKHLKLNMLINEC